jgi:hypothetical protein
VTPAGDLALIETYSRMLDVAPSGRLAMLRKVADKHGLDQDLLPPYVIDAPSDMRAVSSELHVYGLNGNAAAVVDPLKFIGAVKRKYPAAVILNTLALDEAVRTSMAQGPSSKSQLPA